MFAKPPCTRRSFLARSTAAAAGLALGQPALAQSNREKLPVTGSTHDALEPFDRLMSSFVDENKVPGAALAVTRNGKLVYARGFGYADVDKKEPVLPDALFRIASVSKPITAVAVLRLAEKGKFKLDDAVDEHLKRTPIERPKGKRDPRWKLVTIRQCLQHTGGWDRDKSFDPIVRPLEIAKALGIEPPVTPVHVVRYMRDRPLDFDPGERYAYSNLGYLVLGRIIETVTGQGYEAHVQKQVLEPLGINAMRLGRARVEHRAKGEVRYYVAGNPTGRAVYPPRLGEKVPVQYGADNLEAYEAHGGWIASAVDLVKFAAGFDDPARCPVLGAKAIADMWARPEGAAGKPRDMYYGCGWSVRPVGKKGANTWHTGYIRGSEALLVRRWDGLNWAVLFNTSDNPAGKSLVGLIDGRVHEAADRVKRWPDGDQFEKFLK